MTPSKPPPQQPPISEIQSHLVALMKLRRQMLELHSRLEYLRLMLRLSARR